MKIVSNYFTGNEPIEIHKGRIYTTLPRLEQDYFVSLDVKATSFIRDWQNIIHFTTGGDHDTYGYRTPAIFFGSNRKISIMAAINGNSNYHYDDPVQRKENEWINIQISQQLVAGGRHANYTIQINGDTVHAVENEWSENPHAHYNFLESD